MSSSQGRALVDVNLLDLAAEPSGEVAPFALGRRLPAMVAELLRAAGLTARHLSATVPLDESGRLGFAVPAGLLDVGDAIEMSKRLGPAHLLVHGQLGPPRRGGMSLRLLVLRRDDGAAVAEIDRVFYEEEVLDVARDVAREVAELRGAGALVDALEPGGVLGTARAEALLRLEQGLDGLTALEGGVGGADAARTADHLLAAVEADPRCDRAAGRVVGLVATWLDEPAGLAACARLVAARPGDEAARRLLGRLHERRGDLERAEAVLASAPWPASTTLAADRARVLLGLGRAEEARALLEAQPAGGPGAADRAELQGLAFARSGRLADARRAFRAGLDLEPDRPALWANLGRCLHLLGRGAEARAAYERALELDGSSWQAARNFAELAMAEGDLERAEALLRLWADRRPGEVEPALALAELLAATDRREAARRLLEEALEGAPDDARLHAMLGAVLLGDGDRERAEEEYRHALELGPDDPALLTNVALLLAERGEVVEGERLARRACALAPDDAVAARALEHVLGKN